MDGGAGARSSTRHGKECRQETEREPLSSSPSSRVEEVPRDNFLDETCRQRRTHWKSKRRRLMPSGTATVTFALLASGVQKAMAQSCISLADSTACSAFNASSISTNSNLTGLFPFLSDVTDTASFDSGLQDYITNRYTQTK